MCTMSVYYVHRGVLVEDWFRGDHTCILHVTQYVACVAYFTSASLMCIKDQIMILNLALVWNSWMIQQICKQVDSSLSKNQAPIS